MKKLITAAVLCAASGLLAPQVTSGAVTGSFSSTGSMGTIRVFLVAVALPDGKVLVAGGSTGASPGTALDSAEVFDPSTNSFSSAGIGSMGTARYEAAAAPLPDGTVLILGGINNSGKLDSAEVFDPATNSFSSTGLGTMGTGRAGAVAAPLPDGRVLVAGGWEFGAAPTASAEVFDPDTKSFSSVGSMVHARGDASAAPLPDGRVLVAGGGSSSGDPSAEVFDPTTDSFTSVGIGSMSTSRAGAAAAPLPNGRVLIAGGYGSATGLSLSSAEVFSASTNSFSAAGIGAMGTRRWGPAAAPLPGGRALVVGGSSGYLSYLSSAEIFTAVDAPDTPATTSVDAPEIPAATPIPTGARAAALKKCNKKFPKGPKRKKCIKKAKKLPV